MSKLLKKWLKKVNKSQKYYKVDYDSEKFTEFWQACKRADEIQSIYPNEVIGISTYIVTDKGSLKRMSFKKRKLRVLKRIAISEMIEETTNVY